MAYAGKFIDRCPIICAAGKPNVENYKLKDCLREYPLNDQIDAIKHEMNVKDQKLVPQQLPATKRNFQIPEVDPGIKSSFPPPEPKYHTLIKDLKESAYDSYWKCPLGHTSDPTPGLPQGMDPETVTFGKFVKRDVSVKELVNPPKTPYQVLYDSQVNHENYKTIYNDYNPGEQINRKYSVPSFNSNATNGVQTFYDIRGIGAKCGTTWFNQNSTSIISKLEANYLEKYRRKMGKALEPNGNINKYPEGHTFGRRNVLPLYGVEGLLRDPLQPVSLFKRDVHCWLASFNRLKRQIQSKLSPVFRISDLLDEIRFSDKEHTGFVPLRIMWNIFDCHLLTCKKEHIEALMCHLKLINQEKIDYEKFLNLFNSEMELGQQLDPFAPGILNFTSTTQSSSCDFRDIDNSGDRPAGVPSKRTDLDREIVPLGGCRADIENLSEYTTAGDLIRPSIFTHYGLDHRDFYLPRSQEFIRTLFKRIGYDYTDETFEKLWEYCKRHDQSGQVCVDTFYKLIQCVSPVREKLRVDEVEC